MTDLRRIGELMSGAGAAAMAPGLARIAAERESLRERLGPLYDEAVLLEREAGLPFEQALAAVQDPLMAAAIWGARATGQPVAVVLVAIKAGIKEYCHLAEGIKQQRRFIEAMHRLRTDPGMPPEEVEELQRKMLATLTGGELADDGEEMR